MDSLWCAHSNGRLFSKQLCLRELKLTTGANFFFAHFSRTVYCLKLENNKNTIRIDLFSLKCIHPDTRYDDAMHTTSLQRLFFRRPTIVDAVQLLRSCFLAAVRVLCPKFSVAAQHPPIVQWIGAVDRTLTDNFASMPRFVRVASTSVCQLRLIHIEKTIKICL